MSLQSKFEFKLRLQEFIELVRGERMIEAIMYARKYLASWGATNMKELQQAMATLAFKTNTDCPGYKVFSLLFGGLTLLVSSSSCSLCRV
jgi:predicted metal-binding membrane protein